MTYNMTNKIFRYTSFHLSELPVPLSLLMAVMLAVAPVAAWADDPVVITSLSQITDLGGSYKLDADIDASGLDASLGEFTGTLDGGLHTVSGLTVPLFSTVNGGTVCNVIFTQVNIQSGTNVGVVTGEMTGTSDKVASVYNCGVLSGSVSGTGDVGSLVGRLGQPGSTTAAKDNCYARVVNCYSFAIVAGGSNKGGIVGNNCYATKASDIRSMVMNCMFYGDIAAGDNVSPIYGGTNINNLNSGGLTNYNYYRYESPFSKNGLITSGKYNCALAMEERFLVRFEFYRLLLNSNKRLAAFYATGSKDNASLMAKWVLDKSVADYPILKPQGKYPSVINYDAAHAEQIGADGEPRNVGRRLGTLDVTIDGLGSNYPSTASLSVTQLTLVRTDKDTVNFNFNYDKVQLPYYNDVGDGNYTENKVVTGWIITEITGGTEGTYTAADEWGGYNFADRNCTNKDLYSTSGRVFSQGAYWDVPYGVTAIKIKPYWGQAAYVSDPNLDAVYNNSFGKENVSKLPAPFVDFSKVDINGSTQKVYTTLSAAVGELSAGGTVYDHAIVLVGNVHNHANPPSDNKSYTVMSVDLDKDNEPDYSLIYSHNDRQAVSPIRFDFLNIPGTSMAQMPNGASKVYNMGIFNPKGWYEVTNTCVVRFVQFEYFNDNKSKAPVIFQGGVIDQFVSTKNKNPSTYTSYIHVGGNAWFHDFGNGTHSDGTYFTPHIPISVTGGDYESFYLSGTYRPDAKVQADDAECYISGGRFGELAAAAQQKIDGNVTWQIYDADIRNFFGGGINYKNPVTGNIKVYIFNSHVGLFCGGPKYGNMSSQKTVTTEATGCTFDKFFGAGYGGISYNRVRTQDARSPNFSEWQKNYTNNRGNYISANDGIATDFDYDYFPWSSGDIGGRFYVKYASLSLAQTNDVSSTLNGCYIKENFYGGGSLGKVVGTTTSELKGCTVDGNVYGGGYSATKPTVSIRKAGFKVLPHNSTVSGGIFDMGEMSETEEFTLIEGTLKNNTSAIDETEKTITTNVDLTTLGQVANTNLTISGNTVVHGSVFGGGDESAVYENTSVTLAATGLPGCAAQNTTNVYGGGNVANVTGTATVHILSGTIGKDVFGGGYGQVTNVGGNVTVNIGSKTVTTGDNPTTTYSGTAHVLGDVYGGSALGSVNTDASDNTAVNLYGGTLHGDVYGGGLGQLARDGRAASGTEGEPGYVPAVTAQTAIPAMVNGNVSVLLDGAAFDYQEGTDDLGNAIANSGRIFGCNNQNGTPLGSVTVEVKRTKAASEQHTRTPSDNLSLAGDANHHYEVEAVYGGGNLAAYEPYGPGGTTDAASKKLTTTAAHVIIDGCEAASIRQVYGGGNAASAPATLVDIKGSYEIEEVFGGGNGKDRISRDGGTAFIANPGANVGFYEYADNIAGDTDTPELRASNYGYGSGEANVNIYGGRIHRVFGGSNTKGNVRQIALTLLEKEDYCGDFNVDEAYGGGKSAPMDGMAQLKMACIPGLKAAYGGAQEADIKNDVIINITNGNFERVFGGNNISGNISGTITVNVEETGCNPVVIGQLYGGGNLAPYTAPTGQPGPTVNVRAFTSIGEIYGGGYGEQAVVTGDTYVNVSEVVLGEDDVPGKHAMKAFGGDVIEFADGSSVTLPARAASTGGLIGAIGNVYGGGNAAMVKGNTHVNIGTEAETEIYTLPMEEKTVDGVTRKVYQKRTVQGVDIRGNVYGGGNQADVSGSTLVKVGRGE